MSTLTEIETAAATLLPEQQESLLLFLAERLRDARASLPEPRNITPAQIQQWIKDGEEDMRGFRAAS
jgi:hypothetical protein